MLLFDYVIYPGIKLTLIFIIYKLISIVIKGIRFAQHYSKFPYEPGQHWILGDLLKIAPNFPKLDLKTIGDAIQNYSDRYVFNSEKWPDLFVGWMSWYPIVFASSHKSLEIIMQNSFYKHQGVYSFTGLRDGLVTSNGSKWKSRRKTLEPLFTTRQLSQFVPVLRSIVESTVDSLEDVEGKPIVISDYIHSMTMDAIFEVGFKVPAAKEKEIKNLLIYGIERFEDRIPIRIINPLFWSDWIFSQFKIGEELDQLNGKLDDYLNEFLDKRLNINSNWKDKNVNNNQTEETNKKSAYRDMIEFMADHKDQIDREGMLEEIITMIAAGHETIANATNWLLFALGNHPEIQDRIIEEIDQVISSSEDLDDLNKINQLVYTEQCIKETLRLFPPLPIVLRKLERNIQVGDKLLLKDTPLVIAILYAHHNPEVYPDPFKFDPDRFAPDVVDKIPKYAFIPFGMGSRMCIGYRYAMIEMKIFLTQFLRRYQVKSTKKMDQIGYHVLVVTKPTSPLEVIISSR